MSRGNSLPPEASTNSSPHLTLASASPRRRELLEQLGFVLDVRPADTDESVHPGEAPHDYVLRVAREKARAVPGDPTLAADTAVVLGAAILGKPRDAADARAMLRALSGVPHRVLTGVCVRRGSVELTAVVAAEVRLDPLTDAQIDWYVSTGEPLDKAGAYAIQGLAGAFVRELRGSVSNVIGLPLAETLELLRMAGVPLPWEGLP
jgi:septum formation protein